jgi:hypothetical protein
MATKLGIIAGGGPLPGYLIEACKSSGREYFVLAFKGQAEIEVVGNSPHSWVRLGALERSLTILRKQKCKELVLAGSIKRPNLYQLRPDIKAAKFLSKGLLNRGDDGVLKEIIKYLETEGFTVIGADEVVKGLCATNGPIGKVIPTDIDEADIAIGVNIVRQIGKLDLGQAAIIQNGIVLAIEAVDGTQAMLNRCISLSRVSKGGVLVKLPKPSQEKRADMPTIGPSTVIAASDAGLSGIAVAAETTIVIESDKVSRAANSAGIFVVGVNPDDYTIGYND